MAEGTNSKTSLIPHISVAAVLVLILLTVWFWPSEEEPTVVKVPVKQPEPVVAEPVIPEPIEEDPIPEPDLEVFEDEPEIETTPPPEPEPEPEPLDSSDLAVKTALSALIEHPELTRILVNDEIIRRFVVFVDNLNNEELASNFHVLQKPEKPFRTYQQAGKEWIDAASFKRYTPYVEVLDNADVDKLIELYDYYKPAIQENYAEIGYPDDNFDGTLINAIEHLLDTPEVPIPIEVYTESVVYKFRDERIENLSNAQKQLLRTGPENMRVIKATLREIRDVIDERL
ncbi:DUF3014 domain-containing protein [Alteromonadaceae bacterium M269]|nr:DUF3014 domain-containing protein [Alteromonadaceae bacterium M269]